MFSILAHAHSALRYFSPWCVLRAWREESVITEENQESVIFLSFEKDRVLQGAGEDGGHFYR